MNILTIAGVMPAVFEALKITAPALVGFWGGLLYVRLKMKKMQSDAQTSEIQTRERVLQYIDKIERELIQSRNELIESKREIIALIQRIIDLDGKLSSTIEQVKKHKAHCKCGKA